MKEWYVRATIEATERRIEEIKSNSDSVYGFINNEDLEEYKTVTNLHEIAKAVTKTGVMLSIIDQTYNKDKIMKWLNETVC